MGSWERLKLHQSMNIMCAFTRHWDKKKYNPMLRARNWYRDTHVIPFKEDGDFILCKIVIMGRITKEGSVDTKVRIRWGEDSERFPLKPRTIRLHRNTPINSWDPSD